MLVDSTHLLTPWCSLIGYFDAVEYQHMQDTGAAVVQLQMPNIIPVRI